MPATPQDSLTSIISPQRTVLVKRFYHQIRANFILNILSEQEMRAIDDTEGMGIEAYFFIALANTICRKKPALAKRFDSYERLDIPHYSRTIVGWLKEEQSLLQSRLSYPPTPHDLAEDFQRNNNGSRHRVYYCLRFPYKVKKPSSLGK